MPNYFANKRYLETYSTTFERTSSYLFGARSLKFSITFVTRKRLFYFMDRGNINLPFALVENFLSDEWHFKGLLSLWSTDMSLLKDAFRAILASHLLHLKDFLLLWTERTCLFRLLFFEKIPFIAVEKLLLCHELMKYDHSDLILELTNG